MSNNDSEMEVQGYPSLHEHHGSSDTGSTRRSSSPDGLELVDERSADSPTTHLLDSSVPTSPIADRTLNRSPVPAILLTPPRLTLYRLPAEAGCE
jgi:hypothetical protein